MRLEVEGKLTPEQQKQVTALLAKGQQTLQANPLQAYYPNGPKYVTFHSSHDRVKGFIGGNRSGKTTTGVVDDLIQVVDENCLPTHLKQYKKWEPPFRCRIVTPDFVRTMTAVFEVVRRWVPRQQLLGGNWETAYDKQNKILRFGNGSFFECMTYEQDLDKFGGSARHRIHYDEEPPGDKGQLIRRECQTRLIDYGGDELFTLTPLLGFSWTEEDVYNRRHEAGITVVQVDMDDNPHLNTEAKLEYLKDLTKEELQARKEGKYTHFGGTFYPEFNDDKHVVDIPESDCRERIKDQSIIVGIDPGLNHTAVVWVVFDGDNVALAFDELYVEDLLPPAVAKGIEQINAKWEIKPDFYVIDPSARNRTLTTAEATQAAYTRAGIPAIPGQNDRAAGILEVKRRLQYQGFIASSECRKLIWEFPRYRKDPNVQDEWAAIKRDDHALDALRYVFMTRPYAVSSLVTPEETHWVPGVAPSFEEFEAMTPTTSPPLGSLT